MPILAYDEDDTANFSQTRTSLDLIVNNFPGWTRTIESNSYSTNGSYVQKFVATDTLKGAFKNLQKTEVTELVVCVDQLVKKVSTTDYKSEIQKLITSVNPDYLTLEDVKDDNLQYVPELNNSNLKKLTVSGSFTSLNGVKISDTVQELEISSSQMTSVDPLLIPANAALITEMNSSIFTDIDLSSHKNLSVEDLQKAVNTVYEQRISERAFQGNFAGGYIYSWNLRGTGITSFNEVSVPKLNDGTDRFYIAYVAVESTNSDGTAQEVISEGTEPSNDSQIGEWFDWNEQGWSKVSDIIVTAKDSAKLDFNKTVQEIMGFLAKYPNTVKIDVSALQFTDENKTSGDLVTELKNQIKASYSEESSFSKIQFVTKKLSA